MREYRKFATISTELTGRVIASMAAESSGENPGYGGNWIARVAPAWKQTGISSSSQVAQIGSYTGSLMWGTSRSIMGTAGYTTPLCPLATARLISLTVASTGNSGTIHWGIKRGLALAHSSINQSL